MCGLRIIGIKLFRQSNYLWLGVISNHDLRLTPITEAGYESTGVWYFMQTQRDIDIRAHYFGDCRVVVTATLELSPWKVPSGIVPTFLRGKSILT